MICERGGMAIPQFDFSGLFHGDALEWQLQYEGDEFNHISIGGASIAENGGYFTTISDHNIVIDSTSWTIEPNHGVGLYRDYVNIQRLSVTDGNRFISIHDVDGKDLIVEMQDFALQFINPIIDYDKLYFRGTTDGTVKVGNLFGKRSIQGFVSVDDFSINHDPFGRLLLKAGQSEESVVDIDLSITDLDKNLHVGGYYDMDKQFVNVDLNLTDYPMSFFEYIIDDGISETVGQIDVQAKIYGKVDDMTLSGSGVIESAGTKIDYLGAYYRLENERITITENFIDLNDVTLVDEMGNTAEISGGLRHRFLADIVADADISSDRFIGLNTTDLDNQLYYGLGVGPLDISFYGPFDAIDIEVTATLGEQSRLYIPINDTDYGIEESFIKFDYKEIAQDSISAAQELVERLRKYGVDFVMNLAFTDEAEVQVIYDEATGNVLIGRGVGDLRVNVKRDGEFSVYGGYKITSGHYRYTAYGFIAKPFEITGGEVSWTGDPINATVNVTADYPGLRAPLNTFLQEFVQSSANPGEFAQRQDVDLTMILTGSLFTPIINFDIDFPNLTGALKTLATNKVRTLRATENGINNQVFGLMVFRNFLPENNPLATLSRSYIVQTGGNTITEFLTSQLSLMFSDYLSSQLAEDGFISAIDLEFGLAQNSNPFGTDLDFIPDEVQLNLRNQLANDNFVINLGGNYVRQSKLGTNQDYLTGDFSIDWFITENRRLRLRFYGKYDYDESRAKSRQRYGFGINFRREFGTLTSHQNFKNVMDKMVEDIKREAEQAAQNETTLKR